MPKLTPGMYGDENRLQRIFSWLTRVGLGPSFGRRGGMAIGPYQELQIAAIDSIEANAVEAGLYSDNLNLKVKHHEVFGKNTGRIWVSIGTVRDIRNQAESKLRWAGGGR